MYKRLLIMFILIVVSSLIGIYTILKTYEKNYFGKIGLPRTFSYDEMVRIKGMPLEIVETADGFINVCYDGLILVFLGGKTPLFVRAEIISDRYSFGTKNLKVGDSRAKVDYVCKWLTKIKDMLPNEIGIIEKNEGRDVWVYYEFDQNNSIVKVVLTNGI